jgi:phytoene dehydrogenase-like protein
MGKRVAIVGAGIAGLSAGVYARANGYDVDIFESEGLPGGLCTAWKRHGYTFDGCVQWLCGSGPKSAFYPLWAEVGALEGHTFNDPISLCSFIDKDGRTVLFYADIDRLEQHLLTLSPEDFKPIHELCTLVRTLKRTRMRMDKAVELFGPVDVLRMMISMLRSWNAFSTCANTSTVELAARFKDPLIRVALEHAIHPRNNLIPLVSSLAELANHAAGYPLGGSLSLARAVEGRCKYLGARIHYRRRVRRVVVRDNHVVGLDLEDGSSVDADVVISAADLRRNIEVLLEGRYPSPAHERLFKEVPIYPSSTLISFGLRRAYPENERVISHAVELVPAPTFAGKKLEWLYWHNYSHDPSLAPPGHSVVSSRVDIPYEWWKQLGRESEAYGRAKAELASLVRAKLDRVLPGFDEAVEAFDVATPLTFERYTSNHLGSYMTWILEKGRARALQTIPKTVPGLKGFYMAGMWLMGSGGLPCAVKSARDVVQVLCRDDRVRFRAPPPLK